MAKRSVTNYSLEFKQSISATARELGVNETTLHGWVKHLSPTLVNWSPPELTWPRDIWIKGGQMLRRDQTMDEVGEISGP